MELKQEKDEKELCVSLHVEENESKTKHNIVPPCGIDIQRYSTLTKLLRVTALVLKFIRKLKNVKDDAKYLTCDDLRQAENLWIVYVQRNIYNKDYKNIQKKKPSGLQRQLGLVIDNNGLLRCTGRLGNSCLSEGARQPILLPHKEKFTELVIQRAHKECMHYGISHTLSRTRQTYWITRGRSAVKAALNKCNVCRRYDGGPYKMPVMAPLPSSRVQKSSAFSRTGLDYLGPLNIKTSNGNRKVWICLFSCMTTRAIHLEVIQDLSTEEFLMCLQRFISQRNTPIEIVSDNAAQFKLASKVINHIWKNVVQSNEVMSYVASKGIRWNFIVELAPWMGGFYERLVGVVKSALRKSLGRKLLTMIQLQTLIKEVETVVNSRPLVYEENDLSSNITLTPGHFLTLNPNTGVPDLEDDDGDENYLPVESSTEKLLKIWKKGQRLLNEFWKIWRDQYLVSLRERLQTQLKSGRITAKTIPSVGDVVQIKENLPRGSWKIGRIVELVTSNDGEIRSAKVQLPSKRLIGRPLNLLYLLECDKNLTFIDDKGDTNSEKSEKKPDKVSNRKAAEIAKQKIKNYFK
jgi:hypothetical protein